MKLTAPQLNALYLRYNNKKFIHPDPLEFLSEYSRPQDKEVVGLIASSLAYGRVAQILTSVRTVLNLLGPNPAEKITRSRSATIRNLLQGFRHRFSTGAELAELLINAAKIIRRHGSLGARFKELSSKQDVNIIPALGKFVDELQGGGSLATASPRSSRSDNFSHLLPHPKRGSACKRLMLYLRWMIRHDKVDPGVWAGIPKSKLILPLDTHMFRIGKMLGLTSRKCANLKAAVEITQGFASFAPQDPVKYDFALTRLGIRSDASINELSLLINMNSARNNKNHAKNSEVMIWAT